MKLGQKQHVWKLLFRSLLNWTCLWSGARLAICDVFRNLAPFVQFKKREKHPWRSDTLAYNFTESITSPWVLFTFFNLRKRSKSATYQFAIFNPLSYCFRRNNRIWRKGLVASRAASRLIRWYNKRILIKSYSVPRDFSWIENYKLIYKK